MYKLNKILRNFSYIDSKKFVHADSNLRIYKSTEKRSIILINMAFSGMIGWNIYSFYNDNKNLAEADSELSIATIKGNMENTQLVLIGLFAGIAFFYYKSSHTLKHLWLDANGRTVFMERFSWFGFHSNIKQVDINNFKGVHLFLIESLRIPIFRIQNGGITFFKQNFILEKDVMREILNGKEVKIRPEGMQKELSSSQKKKYNL